MTLVSIVTPSYDQRPFLEQAMRSVLEQDYPHIEYIVMDGGSTDGSQELIRELAPRLAYWASAQDRGQADAINQGFSHAHGEILAWLNSDDYYLPGAVSAAVQAFEQHPEAVLVYGDMLAVNEHGQTTNHLRYKQQSLEDFLCFDIVGQPSVFMRRSAFEAAGGLDLSFHFMLDHQLWIKLARQGPAIHVDQTWSAARYHSGAKNRARALEFGPEAFRLLAWAASDPALAPVLSRVQRRARASAQRLDARYKLDGGHPAASLAAWLRALFISPPVALARLNLPVSAGLELLGLGRLRDLVLKSRQQRLAR